MEDSSEPLVAATLVDYFVHHPIIYSTHIYQVLRDRLFWIYMNLFQSYS